MKPRLANQKTAALTLVEVLVVIAVLAILLTMLLHALALHQAGAAGGGEQCSR